MFKVKVIGLQASEFKIVAGRQTEDLIKQVSSGEETADIHWKTDSKVQK